MSKKPHLILWGGSWLPLDEPLSPDNVDSHAKVNYVFLKAALSKYFDITGIEELEKIKDVQLQDNTVGVLSTFQAGFTQIKSKKPEIYDAIKDKLKGKMFSIIDETTFSKTIEDRLFTVIPTDYAVKNRLQSLFGKTKYHHMGWSAEPEYCYPEPSDIFTIFIDHGHYAGTDYTHLFMVALKELNAKHNFRAFIQTNQGVEQWDFNNDWHNETYERENKIPWRTMMEYYRQSDLFCLTHLESAGLSSIESAMCGAKLIVPELNGRSFLHRGLLKAPIDYVHVDCSKEAIIKALDRIFSDGVDKKRNYEAIKATNSWDLAAERINKALL